MPHLVQSVASPAVQQSSSPELDSRRLPFTITFRVYIDASSSPPSAAMAPLAHLKVDPAAAATPPLVLSISHHDAVDTLRHDREMKRALLGIPFPVLYFCIFVAMLSRHIPTSDLYEQAYSVSSVLDSSGTDALTTSTTMKYRNIATTSDVFDWLTDTFIPSIFITEDYNGDLLQKDKWGRIAMYNKVLGAVFFQVTKNAIHPCEAAQFLVDLYPNCYDPNNVVEDTVLISFDTNTTQATQIISKLKANGDWLDFATQQLLITVVAYNGEVQGYTVSKLTLDFHQGGYIQVSSTTTPTISDPYKAQAALVLDILVGICLLVSLVPFLARAGRLATRHGSASPPMERVKTWIHAVAHGGLFFVVLELAPVWCVVSFYIIWFSMVTMMYDKTFRDNLARLVVTGKTFDANSNERNGLVAVTKSLEQVAQFTTALRVLAMASVVALGVTILMQFRFHPRLNILTRTVANALHQFGAFFVVFVVIFMTFSVSGMVLFGDRVADFATLSQAMETCVNMLFGNFDYAAIQDLQAPLGMLYYWAYMVVVCLVLLNMMLAIVLDSYAETNEQAAKNKYSVLFQRTSGTLSTTGACISRHEEAAAPRVLWWLCLMAASFRVCWNACCCCNTTPKQVVAWSPRRRLFRGLQRPNSHGKMRAVRYSFS